MKGKITKIAVWIVGIAVCYPLVFLVSGSIMNYYEVHHKLAAVFGQSAEFVEWSFLPTYPSIRGYVELLLDTPQFFVMFWNSVQIVICVVIGQIVFAVPAAWALAIYRFKGRKGVVFVYIVLMMLPFQSIMLPQYIVLNRMNMLDHLSAVIMPGIFSSFPVFIMYIFFQGIPKGILDAARLDGATEWGIFRHIGLPLGKAGIYSICVLGILEYWNLLEQPMIFLEDKKLWPLSLIISDIEENRLGLSFAAAVMTFLPPLLTFILGQEYLVKGIELGGGRKSV